MFILGDKEDWGSLMTVGSALSCLRRHFLFASHQKVDSALSSGVFTTTLTGLV